jgi:hypothetical protein
MEDESMLISIVQSYANRFGITFSSRVMDNEELKPKLMQMMMEALGGKRGPVTDEDLGL